MLRVLGSHRRPLSWLQELDGRLLRVSIVDPEQEGDENDSLDSHNEQF